MGKEERRMKHFQKWYSLNEEMKKPIKDEYDLKVKEVEAEIERVTSKMRYDLLKDAKEERDRQLAEVSTGIDKLGQGLKESWNNMVKQ